MTSLFSNIYAVLLRPVYTLEKLAQRSYWWQAALILWLIATLNTLNYAGEWQIKTSNIFALLFVGWGSYFFLWLGLTILFTLTADLFGGKGQITDTMAGLGFALTPLLLWPSVSSLPNVLGSLGFPLRVLALLGLFFWILVLSILGLKSAQKFSLDRSIASVLISFILLLALGGAFVMLLGLQLTLLSSQLS